MTLSDCLWDCKNNGASENEIWPIGFGSCANLHWNIPRHLKRLIKWTKKTFNTHNADLCTFYKHNQFQISLIVLLIFRFKKIRGQCRLLWTWVSQTKMNEIDKNNRATYFHNLERLADRIIRRIQLGCQNKAFYSRYQGMLSSVRLCLSLHCWDFTMEILFHVKNAKLMRSIE